MEVQFSVHGLRGSLCSMEMQVPPEQASMPDPGHMSDPHLTLTSLDLYAESPGHLQPVSFMSLSPCSCALSAKSCWFFPALDAPSSSVCLAVPSQDRLPCASLPITQGDCEARGCCYDPRDSSKKPCYFSNTGKPAHLLSLPPELLQNRISHFAGRASQHLVCTAPAGGSGLCFWLPRISCPSQVSSIFQSVATHLVLCPASVLLLELAALVLPYLALVLWVKGRTSCRTCWSCLGCDVRASFPSLLSLSWGFCLFLQWQLIAHQMASFPLLFLGMSPCHLLPWSQCNWPVDTVLALSLS